MNIFIFLIIIIAFIWNVLMYAWVWLIWRRDCKEIGIEHLAVSLKERFSAVFLCVTLPCLIVVAVAIIKK